MARSQGVCKCALLSKKRAEMGDKRVSNIVKCQATGFLISLWKVKAKQLL